MADPFSGGTIAGTILPDVTGRDLGSPTQQWDAFIQNLIVYGTFSGSATSINNIQFADQFAGADAGAKIIAAIAALPSTGGIVIANFQGNQTATTTIALGSKPVYLILGAMTLTSSAIPAVSCASSSFIEGCAAGCTTIIFTGTNADGVQWTGSRGGMRNLAITGQAGARHGITLIASGTTTIQHNSFYNLTLTGQTTAGNFGVKLVADSATALCSFNDFFNLEVVGFADSVNINTSGSAGPTNNHFYGGHLRKTAAAGNGINVASGGNNSSDNMDISGHAIGIRLDSANTTNYQDHGSTLESNTLDISVTNSAADNAFIGTSYATLTDNGIRTLQENTNSMKVKLATLTGGQISLNTEDANAGQQPVLYFQKSISALVYGYVGLITNTLSGVGANFFGRLGAAGQDIWDILDSSSGAPKFNIGRKGAGGVFSVDQNGNTLVGGTLGVTGASSLTTLTASTSGSLKQAIYPRTDITLANGANSDIALSGTTFARIVGPTGVFNITGFAAGVDGRVLHLFNSVAFAMTITNEATSSATNRITTLTGADVVLRAGKSFASFVYDGGTTRWILMSSN